MVLIHGLHRNVCNTIICKNVENPGMLEGISNISPMDWYINFLKYMYRFSVH